MNRLAIVRAFWDNKKVEQKAGADIDHLHRMGFRVAFWQEKMQENFCLTFSKKKNIILVNE